MKKRDEYLTFGKPDFNGGEVEAVVKQLASGWVGMGAETKAFEEELAVFTDAPHVVTVNSCTAALHLSLLIHNVGPGDEVVCPSLTWCSSANVALYVGAKPVFCDIDPDTYCVTPESIMAKVTDKTKAVVVVHMAGYAIDVKELREKLPAHIAIVEDAAHALGSCYPDGSPVGSAGNLTCYSFYANKNLSTGEGGAIAAPTEEIANKLVSLRLHGLSSDAWKRFTDPKSQLVPSLNELGYKMNYTDLQACIGRIQLKRLPEFAKKRQEIAKRYATLLAEHFPDIKLQEWATHDYHARHLFLIELPLEKMSLTRDEVVIGLREMNVGASIHYAPLHDMPLYQEYERSGLANTDHLCERILTLPISVSMEVADTYYVIDALKTVLD